ncbi:MAG: hypothetical protein M1829_001431 [Trizodia sp. TS-e1964]|nr:MAG: hypothetical protein M1829_001431 [Trizodia sp. TS-e1964]
MSDPSRLKATLYVGGLEPGVTADVLRNAFIPFGEIVEISLPKPEAPSSTEPHRGFGYVEFEAAADARDALDNMDQSELFGRVIKVAAAKPVKEQAEALGSRTALWEQEGWLARHAVSEEDRIAADSAKSAAAGAGGEDPMQGLAGLDVAGPKPA